MLVAIAIPVFTTQLEKAREGTDVANARDYYAEISTAVTDGTINSDSTVMKVSGGLEAEATYDTSKQLTEVKVTGTTVHQKGYGDWAMGTDFEIGGVQGGNIDCPASSAATTITYKFSTDNGHTYLSDVDWGGGTGD